MGDTLPARSPWPGPEQVSKSLFGNGWWIHFVGLALVHEDWHAGCSNHASGYGARALSEGSRDGERGMRPEHPPFAFPSRGGRMTQRTPWFDALVPGSPGKLWRARREG